jgi:hypothetical protein
MFPCLSPRCHDSNCHLECQVYRIITLKWGCGQDFAETTERGCTDNNWENPYTLCMCFWYILIYFPPRNVENTRSDCSSLLVAEYEEIYRKLHQKLRLMPTQKGRTRICSPVRTNGGGCSSFCYNRDGYHGLIHTTPRGNKYLLTFIDYFSKYVEDYPICDQTASACAKVYAIQIVTRHGTGSQLITDQGRAFMSSFFQETCKLLGKRRTRTTALHPSSNGQVERFNSFAHWTFPLH